MSMNPNPPRLFDLNAVARNAARGKALAQAAGADFEFLRREVADRMQDRLLEINRHFDQVLDIGDRFRMKNARAAALPNDDAVLDAVPGSCDLVVSNLALHWVNDLPGLLVQANHALKPDGLFIASLFGGDTLHELRHALISAEAEISGGASARVIPFADVRDLGGLLQRAGFSLPVADLDTITVTYTHPLKLMHDLRGMGEANALVGRSRTFLRRDILMRACEIYAEKYALPDGRVPATFQVVYLTGWHPHASQQKPLKPGSGKVNLADALRAGKPPKKD